MSAQRSAVCILGKGISPLLHQCQILLNLIEYAVNPGILRQVAPCPEPRLNRCLAQLGNRRNHQQRGSARRRSPAGSQISFVGQDNLCAL
ncbi:hypothetical protein D3C73_1487400 [compost metagenome]